MVFLVPFYCLLYWNKRSAEWHLACVHQSFFLLFVLQLELTCCLTFISAITVIFSLIISQWNEIRWISVLPWKRSKQADSQRLLQPEAATHCISQRPGLFLCWGEKPHASWAAIRKVAEWVAGVSWILSVQFGVDRKMKRFKCDSSPQDIIQKVTWSNIQEHSQQVQWSFKSKWDCWHPAGWPHWCLICSIHRPLAKFVA